MFPVIVRKDRTILFCPEMDIYNDTVNDLKTKIYERTGIPIAEQILVSIGRKLKSDTRTLYDYGLGKQCLSIYRLDSM